MRRPFRPTTCVESQNMASGDRFWLQVGVEPAPQRMLASEENAITSTVWLDFRSTPAWRGVAYQEISARTSFEPICNARLVLFSCIWKPLVKIGKRRIRIRARVRVKTKLGNPTGPLNTSQRDHFCMPTRTGRMPLPKCSKHPSDLAVVGPTAKPG